MPGKSKQKLYLYFICIICFIQLACFHSNLISVLSIVYGSDLCNKPFQTSAKGLVFVKIFTHGAYETSGILP